MSKGLGRVQKAFLQEFALLLKEEGSSSFYGGINRRDGSLTRLNRNLADRLAIEDGRMQRWQADFKPHGNWTWELYYQRFHRSGILLSISHARRRLIEAGYLEKEWRGVYLDEPAKWKRNVTPEEHLVYLDEQWKRREKRPGYYLNLTDKGRDWVEANPKPKKKRRTKKGE